MSIHIGQRIKARLDEMGKSVEWFAGELKCTEAKCNKIFADSNIDCLVLVNICKILDYNFFVDLSNDFQEECRRKGIILR